MDKKGQLDNLSADIKENLKGKTYGIDQIRSPDVQALIEPNSIRLLQLDHEKSKLPQEEPPTKVEKQPELKEEEETKNEDSDEEEETKNEDSDEDDDQAALPPA